MLTVDPEPLVEAGSDLLVERDVVVRVPRPRDARQAGDHGDGLAHAVAVGDGADERQRLSRRVTLNRAEHVLSTAPHSSTLHSLLT